MLYYLHRTRVVSSELSVHGVLRVPQHRFESSVSIKYLFGAVTLVDAYEYHTDITVGTLLGSNLGAKMFPDQLPIQYESTRSLLLLPRTRGRELLLVPLLPSRTSTLPRIPRWNKW